VTRPWREAPILPTRLARAVNLRVTVPAHPGEPYLVDGGDEPHWVNLAAVDEPACDCGDHLFRENLCAHALAVLLHQKDARVVCAMGQLVRDAWLDKRLILVVTRQRMAPSPDPS
jgi:hypothetical protein